MTRPLTAVRRHAWTLVPLALLMGCSRSARDAADPIPDIPRLQQRTVTRSEFRWQWPFTVGTGTLGCSAGGVVFRTRGVSYALNDAAKGRGHADVDALRLTAPSPPPRNPLPGVNQDARMRIFADAAACERLASVPAATEARRCKDRVRSRHALSNADLQQIDTEGRERLWPPLPPRRMSVDPLIAAGLELCQGQARTP